MVRVPPVPAPLPRPAPFRSVRNSRDFPQGYVQRFVRPLLGRLYRRGEKECEGNVKQKRKCFVSENYIHRLGLPGYYNGRSNLLEIRK